MDFTEHHNKYKVRQTLQVVKDELNLFFSQKNKRANSKTP